VSLFAGHAFAPERDNKPNLKFCMKKVVLLIYRMMSRMLAFDGWFTNFWGPLESFTGLRLSGMFKEVYHTGINHVW
jgi:hypothetical protein